MSKVKRRDDKYVDKSATKIWLEEASPDNPYLTEDAFCHGYNFLDLVENKSYSDIVYLLFKGELPSLESSRLFTALMVACITPGPRSPAARAAVLAGVGKTDPELILPIALNILSGKNGGAADILPSMRFIVRNVKKDPEEIIANINDSDGATALPPGFAQVFGGSDPLTVKLGESLATYSEASQCLPWVLAVARGINNGGLLMTGLFSAVLCDLGFSPKVGGGIFQICNAPGLCAHGFEFIGQPLTSVPFLDDDDYFIEDLK